MSNETIEIHEDYCRGLSKESVSEILLQIETMISSAYGRTVSSSISEEKAA